MDKPTPETSNVLIARSRISVALNPNLAREGVYVTLYSNCDGDGASSLGAFARSIIVQLWFSGSLCSVQKSPWQYWHLKGKGSSLPQYWHFTCGFSTLNNLVENSSLEPLIISV
jgi:hypothetical protein